MRDARFRAASDRDWGLAPYSIIDDLVGIGSAAKMVYWNVVERPFEARRLNQMRKAAPKLQLSIGSGISVPEGWIGIDRKKGHRVARLDIRRDIPLPDRSVDGILCEHVIEHLPYDYVPFILEDYRRILKPGSPIRIMVPDAELVAELLTQSGSNRFHKQLVFDAQLHRWGKPDELTPFRAANRLAYQFGDHKALLAGPTLTALLTHAGFTGACRVEPQESRHFDEVPGIHFDRYPDSVNEALVVEALSPQ